MPSHSSVKRYCVQF